MFKRKRKYVCKHKSKNEVVELWEKKLQIYEKVLSLGDVFQE